MSYTSHCRIIAFPLRAVLDILSLPGTRYLYKDYQEYYTEPLVLEQVSLFFNKTEYCPWTFKPTVFQDGRMIQAPTTTSSPVLQLTILLLCSVTPMMSLKQPQLLFLLYF